MKSKKILNGGLIFDAVLLVIFLAYFLTSFSFNEKNKVFPLLFAGLGTVLATFNLLFDLRDAKRSTADAAPLRVDWTPLLLILVMAAYLFGIYLMGSVIATTLFSFLFVVFWGKQKVKTGLICAGISFAVIYGVFGLLMKMQLYPGLLDLL